MRAEILLFVVVAAFCLAPETIEKSKQILQKIVDNPSCTITKEEAKQSLTRLIETIWEDVVEPGMPSESTELLKSQIEAVVAHYAEKFEDKMTGQDFLDIIKQRSFVDELKNLAISQDNVKHDL